MPRCHDNVLDAPLNYLKANVSAYHMCSAQPVDFAEVATYTLGSVSLDLSAAPIDNGDTDGRKLTIPGTTITATGPGGVVCVALVSADTLLCVNELDALLTVALDYDAQLPSWDIEFGDPTIQGAG